MGEKKLILEIMFKDGRTVTLRPRAFEAEKAIKAFESGKSRISIGTLEGGLESSVFNSSEVKGIIPRWVEE